MGRPVPVDPGVLPLPNAEFDELPGQVLVLHGGGQQEALRCGHPDLPLGVGEGIGPGQVVQGLPPGEHRVGPGPVENSQGGFRVIKYLHHLPGAVVHGVRVIHEALVIPPQIPCVLVQLVHAEIVDPGAARQPIIQPGLVVLDVQQLGQVLDERLAGESAGPVDQVHVGGALQVKHLVHPGTVEEQPQLRFPLQGLLVPVHHLGGAHLVHRGRVHPQGRQPLLVKGDGQVIEGHRQHRLPAVHLEGFQYILVEKALGEVLPQVGAEVLQRPAGGQGGHVQVDPSIIKENIVRRAGGHGEVQLLVESLLLGPVLLSAGVDAIHQALLPLQGDLHRRVLEHKFLGQVRQQGVASLPEPPDDHLPLEGVPRFRLHVQVPPGAGLRLLGQLLGPLGHQAGVKGGLLLLALAPGQDQRQAQGQQGRQGTFLSHRPPSSFVEL